MPNIFQIRQINNQQTINSNRFSIRFPGLTEKLKVQAPTSTLWGIQDRYAAVEAAIGETPGESLELSLFSAGLPSIALEKQFLNRFNDGVKSVTKFAEMEDLEVVFYDYVNGSASAIMQLWHAFVGDKRTGAIGFKQDFVLAEAYFYVYGPDAPGYSDQDVATMEDQEIPWLQKYKIVNIFPLTVALGEHSQETAEARRVTITFSVDNIYPVGIRNYKYENTTPADRYSKVPEQRADASAT